MVMKHIHPKVHVATFVFLIAIFGAALFSYTASDTTAQSSEAGFVSFSPRGASGGAIIPASCESNYSHTSTPCPVLPTVTTPTVSS